MNIPQSSELIVCSIIHPGRNGEINCLLLAESIRSFGGGLASCPVWFMSPQTEKAPTTWMQKHLEALDIQLIPFSVTKEDQSFFFKVELMALIHAESLAIENSNLLAWLDSNTIILQEPRALLLPGPFQLAYKPVHHLLLGSRYDLPIDPFWLAIYQHCQVPHDRLFPMKPMVEDVSMRPYFNAGILVTRPQNRFLRRWFNKFNEVYQLPVFHSYYQKSPRYQIFMHQAILAGMILNQFSQEEITELPHNYNYPAHLWQQDNTRHRPANFNEVVTLRHEGFYNHPSWRENMPVKKEIIHWIGDQLEKYSEEKD